jgi:PhzF family phenazine biosynthesis protein
MKIKIFQIDAFSDKVFGGNPAAVCPLDSWLEDSILQQIAAENNLAETSFFVPEGDVYRLRWFTPKAEVDLCGHATVAAASVMFNQLNYKGTEIAFQSRSGILKVTKNGDWYALNFPSDTLQKIEIKEEHRLCFDKIPAEIYKGKSDLMFVFDKPDDIMHIKPGLLQIASLPQRGVIVTSTGTDVDFISRFFGPAVGIPEDPVTGSAHTSLTPYWSKRLHKTELTARQVSERGGYLKCKMLGERVEISGQAAFYLSGEIVI